LGSSFRASIHDFTPASNALMLRWTLRRSFAVGQFGEPALDQRP
jgi:hypothetical protein